MILPINRDGFQTASHDFKTICGCHLALLDGCEGLSFHGQRFAFFGQGRSFGGERVGNVGQRSVVRVWTHTLRDNRGGHRRDTHRRSCRSARRHDVCADAGGVLIRVRANGLCFLASVLEDLFPVSRRLAVGGSGGGAGPLLAGKLPQERLHLATVVSAASNREGAIANFVC